ncbi:MAG: apolipoprotein N-acyltransferase [Acidobacteriota bacterium]
MRKNGAGFGWTLLLALGGGAAWAMCFAREGFLLLPFLGLTPLVALLPRRRPIVASWLFGVAFWAVSTSWLVPTVHTFGGLSKGLGAALFALLCGYLSLDFALFGWLGSRLWRRGGVWRLATVPSLWVVLEWKRGVFFGGYLWNLAGYAAIDVPGALDAAAWLGAFGLSFVLALSAVAVCLGVLERRWRTMSIVGVGLVLLLASANLSAPTDAGVRIEDSAPPSAPEADDGLRRVAIVQPAAKLTSVPIEIGANYRRMVNLSRAACRGDVVSDGVPRRADEPTLVLWPESGVWPGTWESSPGVRRNVYQLVADGCPVLLNSPVIEDGEQFNSVLLIAEGGRESHYAKRRLVPWGEYVPLADLFPFVGKLARMASDFTPGRSTALLPWSDERLAAAVCYEVIFPMLVADQARDGATLLVTVTNDGWYGDSWAPWQHLRAARFRAAETRRPMLRAALTGVSAVIDARGRVAAELGVGERGLLTARVGGSGRQTLFTRAPRALPTAALGVVVFAILWGLRRPGSATATTAS